MKPSISKIKLGLFLTVILGLFYDGFGTVPSPFKETVMKKIKLTQGKYAFVDDADYKELSRFRWSLDRRSNHCYVVRVRKESEENLPKKIYMHRQILGFPAGDIDHINNKGWDNQRHNIRACSRSENMANTEKHKNNTSGLKGVWWDEKSNVWESYIVFNRKKIHIFNSTSKAEAAECYDRKALELYGDFAKINCPNKKAWYLKTNKEFFIGLKKRKILSRVNTSGYRGVCLLKKINKYKAAIQKNGVSYSLGRYDKPIEAAKVYDKKALEFFGEKAKLNFQPEKEKV